MAPPVVEKIRSELAAKGVRVWNFVGQVPNDLVPWMPDVILSCSMVVVVVTDGDEFKKSTAMRHTSYSLLQARKTKHELTLLVKGTPNAEVAKGQIGLLFQVRRAPRYPRPVFARCPRSLRPVLARTRHWHKRAPMRSSCVLQLQAAGVTGRLSC